jgi:hypothetical protein
MYSIIIKYLATYPTMLSTILLTSSLLEPRVDPYFSFG